MFTTTVSPSTVFCLLADGRNGTHIFVQFLYTNWTINHTLVSVWIHFVNMVTVKGKWSSCFHCRFNNQSNEFFDWNDAFRDTVVSHTIKISFFPFFSVIILQSITFLPIKFHEDTSNTNCLQSGHEPFSRTNQDNKLQEIHHVLSCGHHRYWCAIVKFRNILVPYIQVYSHSSLDAHPIGLQLQLYHWPV